MAGASVLGLGMLLLSFGFSKMPPGYSDLYRASLTDLAAGVVVASKVH